MQVEIVMGIAADAGDIDCHEAGDYGGVDEAIEATGAVVVVAGAADGKRYDPLLYRHPQVSVLSLGGNGDAALHELRPHRSVVGDISAAELVATIRAAAGARAGRPV